MNTSKNNNRSGFYLCAANALIGKNIKIVNSLTGADVVVFDNGIGGIAAEMKNGTINEIRIFDSNGGIGYYIQVSFNQVSMPYNFFTVDGSGNKL